MKTLNTLIALGLMLILASQAVARDTVVALSSAQATEDLKGQTERVLVHLLETMQPGDRAWFYDATEAQLIGTFDLPEKAVSASPKQTLMHNKATVAKIGQFVRGAEPVSTHPNRIDLPQLLRSVRANLPAGEMGADLIILGHPLHMPENVPSQSMLGGRVPSDGHIAATPGQSIYGTSGLSGSISGYRVYFGLVGENWAVSPPHAHHVIRFWTLSVEAHGGTMAYIGSDLETLFARAGQDGSERRHDELLRPAEKLEMLTFAADDGQVPDIYRRPLEVAPAPEPIWQNASSVTIGITWKVHGADLDLYVRPTPDAAVVFFQQADTPEGRLFKDFTLSPGNGFETVALKQPVDLSQMRLAVNYYGGTQSTSGVSGELRISIGDQVWAKPIHVSASSGNKGAGAAQVLQDETLPNDAWIMVNPLAVIGVD